MSRWFESIERRLGNLISRGILTTEVKEGEVQYADASSYPGQDFPSVLRTQNYGFTSVPDVGAEVILIFEGGSQEIPRIISADHPELRPKIKKGEVCVWSSFGSQIYLKEDKSLDVTAGSLKMVFEQAASVKTTSWTFESPKFAVKGESDELVSLLIDAYTAIINWATPLAGSGSPMPQSALTGLISSLQPIVTKITSFKVS